MARRLLTSVIRAEVEPKAAQNRLSREIARLTIALFLLLVGTISSALTDAPPGTSGPASFAIGDRLFRNLRAELASRSETPGTELAELRRQEGAYRLLGGDEPSGAVDLAALVRRTRLLPFSWREAEDSLLEYRDRLEATPSISPANGYISSGFSAARVHPILALSRPHRGLDIVAPFGSPIVAPARGRVSFVGHSGEYGLTIEIDHGRGLTTRFAHASRALVRPGQEVARGDTIARVGRSGLAVGSHVHYEVLVDGQPRNPRRYISGPSLNRG
jgi:murein DD-endopeptidase MepM/ murein hydrolase activator NlpD